MTEQGPIRFQLGSGGVSTPTQYSNNVQILLSSWDFTLELSQLILGAPEQENQQPSISMGAAQRIIMSPQHAKAFSMILQQNVRQWEEQFGEIQLPPQNPNSPQIGG